MRHDLNKQLKSAATPSLLASSHRFLRYLKVEQADIFEIFLLRFVDSEKLVIIVLVFILWTLIECLCLNDNSLEK